MKKKQDKRILPTYGKWVSVKDALPPLDKSVIVCTYCGNVFEAMRVKKFDRTQYWTNAVWGYKPMEDMTGRVTHWMLFPEPPKMKGE